MIGGMNGERATPRPPRYGGVGALVWTWGWEPRPPLPWPACPVTGDGRGLAAKGTLVTAHSSYKRLSTCGQLPPVPPPLLSALLPAHAAAITAPAGQRVTAVSVSLHGPVSPAVLFGHLGGVHSLPEKQLRGEPVAEPVGTRRPPSWLPWGNASGASWAQQVTQQQGHLV